MFLDSYISIQHNATSNIYIYITLLFHRYIHIKGYNRCDIELTSLSTNLIDYQSLISCKYHQRTTIVPEHTQDIYIYIYPLSIILPLLYSYTSDDIQGTL